jgi:membrane-bound serine protease (ClpP class)
LCVGLAAGLLHGETRDKAILLNVDDAIGPAITDYIERGLDKANAAGAEIVIIRLDTPGGLDLAMRSIIQAVIASPVPVAIHVAPSGARAASAGTYMMYAAHIAAMAPGTNLGAATPVQMGGMPGMDPPEKPTPPGAPDVDGDADADDTAAEEAPGEAVPDNADAMRKKIVNDAAAYIRSFVAQRGRNVELAEKGVLESLSFTEEEAREGNLIDGIAQDLNDILTKFDGREIQRFDGQKQVLKLQNERLKAIEMTARQKVLSKVLNPNIALILGLIGLLGLYIEFSNPGLIFPGVVGGVCVFLALVAFNILPINLLGVVLILAAIVLFVLEAKVTSYGLLASLGIAVMILGSLILINSPLPELRVQLITAVGITLPFAAITIFLMRLVILAHRNKSVTGKEGMVGEIGTALTDIGSQGKVQVHGEIWQASSPQPIESGNRVRVVAVEGLTIQVTRVSGSGASSS